ncbi:MAG TPA: hypothetical protein VNH12_11675 [Burkholderiales bacterium]|nr:hypothetical protein [Burkholderiales bacterium]
MKGGFLTAALLVGLLAAFAGSWPKPEPALASPARVAARTKARAPAVAKASASATFGGYPCSSGDCAEDKAGFRWAEQNVIRDPDSCSGRSPEFIEGCRVYARRHDPKLG